MACMALHKEIFLWFGLEMTYEEGEKGLVVHQVREMEVGKAQVGQGQVLECVYVKSVRIIRFMRLNICVQCIL